MQVLVEEQARIDATYRGREDVVGLLASIVGESPVTVMEATGASSSELVAVTLTPGRMAPDSSFT